MQYSKYGGQDKTQKGDIILLMYES